MGSKRWKRNRRLKCGCMGYWFPHRRTSGSCYHRADKLAALLVAVRREGGDVEAATRKFHSDADADRLGIPF